MWLCGVEWDCAIFIFIDWAADVDCESRAMLTCMEVDTVCPWTFSHRLFRTSNGMKEILIDLGEMVESSLQDSRDTRLSKNRLKLQTAHALHFLSYFDCLCRNNEIGIWSFYICEPCMNMCGTATRLIGSQNDLYIFKPIQIHSILWFFYFYSLFVLVLFLFLKYQATHMHTHTHIHIAPRPTDHWP